MSNHFLYWTLLNLFDKKENEENEEKRKEKEEKKKRKKQPDLRIHHPVQSAVSRLVHTPQFMQTSSSHLVSPFFFLSLFSSLALSPASLAEKPSLTSFFLPFV